MDVREWMRKPRDATGAGATCVLSRASVRRGYGGIYTARRYVYIPSPTRCGCTRTTSRRDVTPSERSPSTTIIANTQNTSQTIHRTNIAIGIGINQSVRAAPSMARGIAYVYTTHITIVFVRHRHRHPPSIHPSSSSSTLARPFAKAIHPSFAGSAFPTTTTRRRRGFGDAPSSSYAQTVRHHDDDDGRGKIFRILAPNLCGVATDRASARPSSVWLPCARDDDGGVLAYDTQDVVVVCFIFILFYFARARYGVFSGDAMGIMARCGCAIQIGIDGRAA